MTQTFPCGPPIESSMVYGVFLGSLRCEAFYTAYESPDRDEYPNLVLTGQSGLDVIVFDSRCPESVLKFLLLVCKSSCLSTSRHIYICMYLFILYIFYIWMNTWISIYLYYYYIYIHILYVWQHSNIQESCSHETIRRIDAWWSYDDETYGDSKFQVTRRVADCWSLVLVLGPASQDHIPQCVPSRGSDLIHGDDHQSARGLGFGDDWWPTGLRFGWTTSMLMRIMITTHDMTDRPDYLLSH